MGVDCFLCTGLCALRQMHPMVTRREVIKALGTGAIALPVTAFAQQQAKGKLWRVGFLYFASRQSALDTGRYEAFTQGLRDSGYAIGTNLLIEERYADGKV